MRRLRKKIAALALGAFMGFGLMSPQVQTVKAAETQSSGWNVSVVPEDELGDADGVAQDSVEVSAAAGCTTVSGTKYYSKAYEVLTKVNEQRASNGEPALAMDASLMEAAMLRAAEITIKFEHTRPNGEKCFTVSGLAYGENIAYGYSSSEDVMTAWMNSDGHRRNILDSDYTSIGVGCFYKDNTYYWVQLFGINTPETFEQPVDYMESYDVVTNAGEYAQGYTLESKGIVEWSADPRYGFVISMETNAPENADIEYSWYASDDNGASWWTLSDWDKEAYAIKACPNYFGDYLIAGKARKAGDDSTIVMATYTYGYHPAIKGICQMPYTGAGGGYLIGIESYENPNHAYTYEMLILDCTLYAQGLPAWIYTTGRCGAPDTCLWTVWQPQYGYYWTLFRIYDENGNLIDEQCYGFENIC